MESGRPGGSSPGTSKGDPSPPEATPAGGRTHQLLKRSTAVSLLTALSVAAGFLVDVLIVARFGIGAETDAFFGAYTVPFILVTRIAAVQPVLVSILAGYRHDLTAFSTLLNASFVIALPVTAVGMLLAYPLVQATMPGFASSTAFQAAALARILFAEVPAAAVAEVCKAELFARHRFGAAAFSNIIPGLVTAAILLLPGNRAALEVVAWGFVAGALAQAAFLSLVLFASLKAPYRLGLSHPTPILRQTGRLILAPLAGLFLRQGVTLAERLLGSYLTAGSVTAISYANRLNTVVAGVFFDSVTTVSLPSLADHLIRQEIQAARAELAALLRLMAYIAVPLGIAVAALSTPLVLVFFERGRVAHESAVLMGAVVGVYSLSLPFLGPFRAVQNFFYALKATGPIVLLHGGLAALAVVLDLLLVWKLGAIGLALAYAVSSGIMATLGIVWLNRRAGGLGWRSLADSFWRLALTSAAMGATAWGVSQAMMERTGSAAQPRGELILILLVSALAGLAVFLGVGAVLRLEAISFLWQLIRDKLRSLQK